MQSPRRPIVGITCGTLAAAGREARFGVNRAYAAAVAAGGGIAVIIPPAGGVPPLEVLERLDALLLPGGSDIDPSFFGARRSPLVIATDPERDELELALVRAARQRGMPVLGICRGLQLINVAYGGTLYQDLESEAEAGTLQHNTPREMGRNRIVHPISISSGSWFADAAGERQLEVNSLHHQAALAVGEGLEVTARSPDGVVEGLESVAGRTVAIQCHAEELLDLPWATRLFQTFVDQARNG